MLGLSLGDSSQKICIQTGKHRITWIAVNPVCTIRKRIQICSYSTKTWCALCMLQIKSPVKLVCVTGVVYMHCHDNRTQWKL